ncbi:MAG: SEC-C domain-containing protein [Opitutaceae bacterium]|nr:SEC-C domain-containing protein [Opitutaceae bacterium]
MSSTPTASTLVSTSSCPCGSGRNFGDCCAPIIAGTVPAPDAEALMRSRYTAHVVHDTRYLDRTYLPTAKLAPSGEVAPPATKWVKLVINRHDANVRPGVSHVDFSAHFTENGTAGVMHEKSEFELIDGRWFFTRTLRQGPAPVVAAAKVGRNDPCPCGSGKKYKKCCG